MIPFTLSAGVMPMGRRHPQPADRIALKIKFNQHGGLVADHPSVVSRLNRDGLRGFEFQLAAVGVLDVDLAAGENPTCACWQRSVPTSGFICLDQRKPGW